MPRKRDRLARLLVGIVSSLSILALLASCGAGGGGTPAAEGTTDASGGSAGGGQAAAGETATVAIQGPTAVTQKPTGVPQVKCQSNQKQIVWLVRNSAVENAWESNVVRPAFQKAHPELCLNILSINQPDITVKREAMIASGEQLDVWSPNWGGNGFASDRSRGLLTDLTPLIQQDKFDLSVFVPDILKIYQAEGKTWGLPFLSTGSYVYYNKKLFDQAKVPYPTTDWDDTSWNWQKYVDLGKKLTQNPNDINKRIFGANQNIIDGNLEAAPALWGNTVFSDQAYQTGFSDPIKVTDDKSVAAFQAFHDIIYKDKVAPDPAATKALDQLGGAFASGRLAMEMNGGWGHWSYKGLITDPNGFCWGAAPLPMGSPDAKKRAIIFTDPWAITRNLKGDQLTNAWALVKFLVSPEQAAAFTNATGTPPTQTALLKDYYKQFEKCMKPEDMQKVFEGAFTHGRESSNHLLVRWDQLFQVWDNQYTTYFSNANADTKQMLQTLEQQTNEQLEQIKAEGAK